MLRRKGPFTLWQKYEKKKDRGDIFRGGGGKKEVNSSRRYEGIARKKRS